MKTESASYNFFEPVIIPSPKSAVWHTQECVRLGEGSMVALLCSDCTATEWLSRHFEAAFRFKVHVEASSCCDGRGATRPTENQCTMRNVQCAISKLSNSTSVLPSSAESLPTTTRTDNYDYQLRASAKDGIQITANSLQGVRHAFFTLRQIAIPDRGGVTTSGFIMPAFEISDYPSLPFRGMHFCWFPEHTVSAIERQIRLAAYYKFNYVVIENWGVWRSETRPWFGWPDGKMTSSEIRRLKAIADDLGVTLIPQFNIFGHASLSRVRTGNHATLDFAPQYEPLFEPYSGWNWCLSNPEARDAIRALCLELHEVFGKPPFFHIGCDEACPPTCPKCRTADYNQLFASLVREIADDMEKQGASIMMWHDMLLRKGDSRWDGFYANGDARAEELVGMLPKSAVICDWYYGGPRQDGKYPTLDYFKDERFRVLTSPATNREGILAQGAYAASHGLFGLLDTTWTGFNGRGIPETIIPAANAAWGGKYMGTVLNQDHYSPCNWHWRQLGWDMHVTNVRDTGFFNEQYPGTTITW